MELCYSSYSVFLSSLRTVFLGSIYVATSSASDPLLPTAVWPPWGGLLSYFAHLLPQRWIHYCSHFPGITHKPRVGILVHVPFRLGETEYVQEWIAGTQNMRILTVSSARLWMVSSDGRWQDWGLKEETFFPHRNNSQNTHSQCRFAKPQVTSTEMHYVHGRTETDVSFFFMFYITLLSF